MVTIIDGGMGRELSRIGAPFRQPEWSALALMEGPDSVVQAHLNFISAGAEVITTNSYACVPFHIGQDRFDQRGYELAALSGRLARQAADTGQQAYGRTVAVAGSIPPVLGSYKPELFDPVTAAEIASVLIEALAEHIDHWLIETISSISEAATMLNTISEVGDPIARRPPWLSYTLTDRLHDGRAQLRSGESVGDAVDAISGEVEAVLFNCSQPEVMEAAITEARGRLSGTAVRIGAYANAFTAVQEGENEAANATLSVLREDLTPDCYAQFASSWISAGATIVGGCCGITPEHIQVLPR
jgi:S-methylmethionine-dependent homocysteine/selenocysteine methylase